MTARNFSTKTVREWVCARKMYGGPFILPDFCWCCARSNLTVTPCTSLRKMALSPRPWCTAGGGLYVLYEPSGALVNYSPLLHSTPLRLSNERGLSTRGNPSPFIIIFYRWREVKTHYTLWESRVSALLDSGLLWQSPAVFVLRMSVPNSAKTDSCISTLRAGGRTRVFRGRNGSTSKWKTYI